MRRSNPNGDAVGRPYGGHVLYRIALAALLVAGSAHSSRAAADPARCRELIRKYETDKAQLSAIEISLSLFAAANADCINLATALLDGGASVDARDRLGARPLSHAARSGHPCRCGGRRTG